VKAACEVMERWGMGIRAAFLVVPVTPGDQPESW